MPNFTAPGPAAIRKSRDIGFAEFVGLVALMMAITALSIDIMLVALPDIARSLAVTEANDQQLVVTAYMLGFAIGQPFHGPLSDRFGRKPVLSVGLLIFAAASLAAAFSPSFTALLAARALQGFGAAAPRIVAFAVVRDRFAGRGMSQVMSFVMMVFLIVPIVAPWIGQGIVHIGHWPWIFGVLFAASAIALGWSALRLPETRPPSDRMPLSGTALGHAFVKVVTTRATLGYTLAMGLMFGALLSYIGSAQQVFVDVYGLGNLFPLAFGACGAVMAMASVTNARLVGRIGMHRVSHVALIGYVLACVAMALAGFPKLPSLFGFGAYLAVTFFCFGMIAPNFNAIAMEPLGHVAGMGSSFIGFMTTAIGALVGWAVGQSFDGTLRPLTMGMACASAMALIIILITERGALFKSRPQAHPPAQPQPQPGE